MADEKESILFEIKLDIADTKEKAEAAYAAIAKLRAEKAATAKEFKDGNITAEEYGKAMQSIESQTRKASTELKNHTKTLSDNDKIQKSAEGSIVQIRAQLAILTASYINLSKAERENEKTGVALQIRIKGLSDELKSNESAIGSNQRNVGNYAQAIEQSISGNINWIGALRNTAGELKAAHTAAQQYIQGLKGTTDGMGTAQKASFAFGMSLKALGIGLILAAIAGLISFLSRMDAGMDRVEQATAAVGAAFEVLIKAIAPIGEVIVNALLHPIDSFIALAEKLKNPIDSFKQLRDSALGIQGAMGAAAIAAVEYTKAMQDIEDAQDGLIGQTAKVNQQVSLALIAAKDRSRSEKERIGLLDAAGVAERKLAAEVLALKRRELAELMAFYKTKGEIQDADRKKLQEAQAAATNAETESAEKEQQIQNRKSALLEQEAAKRKASADAAKQRAVDAANERVAEADRALIQARKNGEETLSIEEEIIKRQAIAASLGAKGKGASALINAKAEADILKLRVDALIKADTVLYTTAEAKVQARLSLATKGSVDELALQQELLSTQLDKAKANTVDTITNKKEQSARLRELDAKYNVDSENLNRAFAVSQANQQTELGNLRLQTEIDLSAKTKENLLKQQAERIELDRANALALIAAEQLTAEQQTVKINAVEAKAIAERKAVDKQDRTDKLSDKKADIEKGLANVSVSSKKELELKKAALHIERDADLDNETKTEKEKEAIRAKFKKAEKGLDDDFLKGKFDVITESVAKSIAAISQIVESQIQQQGIALDRQQNNALSSAGLSAEMRGKIEENFAKKREKLERDAAEKRRKIATIENIISIARGIVEAQKEPFPLNLIQTAIVVATGVAQQGVIASQKFVDGGPVFGPSHAQGGIQMFHKSGAHMGEMEGNEIILTSNVYKNPYLRAQASAINVAAGGREFSGASRPSSHLALGGFLPTIQSANTTSIDYSQIARAMADAARAIPSPIVYVADIRAGVSQQVRVENKADI